MSKCKPKIVTRYIEAPAKKLKCCNCGCKVKPGECHCGTTNSWAYDSFDGWYVSGITPLERIVIR